MTFLGGFFGFLLQGKKDASFGPHRLANRERSDAEMIEGRVRGVFFLHCRLSEAGSIK